MARIFDDASSQYLEVASPVATAAPFTMACWFNSDNTANNQCLISLADSGSTNNLFLLQARGDRAGDEVATAIKSAAANKATFTTSAYSANTWHHACGVFTAVDERAVFIDGGSKGTSTTSVTPASINRTSIGRRGHSGGGQYMSGRIAWPAIWNVALSDDEVVALAVGVHPTMIRPQNLLAFWPLGGFDGQHDRDVWGRFDMTAYNTPTWADHLPHLIYPCRPLFVSVGPVGPPATGGPYRTAMGQVRQAGPAGGQPFVAGPGGGQSFNTGQTAGQIDGRSG